MEDERKRDEDEKKEKLATRVLREEPTFDKDEGLDEQDKTDADSFPASDPPAH
jgi:hypothetical protein